MTSPCRIYLPASLGSTSITRLHRYYGGSDSCRRDLVRGIGFAPAASMPAGRPGCWSSSIPSGFFPNLISHCRRQVSLLIAFEFPTIPPPTPPLPFRCDRFITLLHRRSLPCLSLGLTRGSREFAVARSRVRSFLGVSPTGLAESSSLALRTGHSPQVALHPPSRKRSYHCRLQAGNVSLTGTYTLLFKRLHRRTRLGRQPHHVSRGKNDPSKVGLSPQPTYYFYCPTLLRNVSLYRDFTYGLLCYQRCQDSERSKRRLTSAKVTVSREKRKLRSFQS